MGTLLVRPRYDTGSIADYMVIEQSSGRYDRTVRVGFTEEAGALEWAEGLAERRNDENGTPGAWSVEPARGPVSYAVVDGRLQNAPVYEEGIHARNWMAVVVKGGRGYDGFERRFVDKARQWRGLYHVDDARAGDVIEFGANYARGASLQKKRWCGVVEAKTTDALIARPCNSLAECFGMIPDAANEETALAERLADNVTRSILTMGYSPMTERAILHDVMSRLANTMVASEHAVAVR